MESVEGNDFGPGPTPALRRRTSDASSGNPPHQTAALDPSTTCAASVTAACANSSRSRDDRRQAPVSLPKRRILRAECAQFHLARLRLTDSVKRAAIEQSLDQNITHRFATTSPSPCRNAASARRWSRSCPQPPQCERTPLETPARPEQNRPPPSRASRCRSAAPAAPPVPCPRQAQAKTVPLRGATSTEILAVFVKCNRICVVRRASNRLVWWGYT
jgi:hypothetical protein